jgi:hypothetical protein
MDNLDGTSHVNVELVKQAGCVVEKKAELKNVVLPQRLLPLMSSAYRHHVLNS